MTLAIITPERQWRNTYTNERQPYEGAPIPTWYSKDIVEIGTFTAYVPTLGKVQRGIITREHAIELTKLWINGNG